MRGWIAGVALLALASCSEPAPDPPVTARDSSGVTILENRLPVSGERPAFTVDAAPATAMGALDGPPEYQFHDVRDATRLPDGRIAVVSSGTADLRLYEPDGTHLWTVGGFGEGPGEFNIPFWLELRGDTLAVWDPFQGGGRFTYYGTGGELLGVESLDVPGVDYPSPQGMLGDGTLIDELTEGSIPPTEMGHVHFTRMPVRYSRSGGPVDTIASAPGREVWREEFRGGVAQSLIPFGREGYTAIGVDRLFLGSGDAPVVDVFDISGTHLLSIRWSRAQPPVTDDLVQRWIDHTLSAPIYEQRPDLIPVNRRRWSEVPVPAMMPALAALAVDAVGRLWVQQYHPPWEEDTRWDVFDPEGRWSGEVSLPPGFRVLEIGGRYLLGVRADDLGVEYVEVYGFRNGGG